MELRPPSPPAHVLELQDTTGKMPTSPPTKDKEFHDTMGKRLVSHPAKDKELHGTTWKRPPFAPAQVLHSEPYTEQLELLPSTDRGTPQPDPSTH
jgi:hypothetical protein